MNPLLSTRSIGRVRLIAIVTATALVAGPQVAPSADFTWGGGTGNWTDVNWNPGPVGGPTTAGNTATVSSGNVTVNVGGPGNLDSIRLGSGAQLNLYNGDGGIFAYGSFGNIILQGGTLNGGAGTYNAYGASQITGLTVSGSTASALNGSSWFNLGPPNTTFTVNDATGDASTDLSVNVALLGAVGSPDTTTVPTSLTKEGAGTLALVARSYYSGGTVVNAGTVILTANSGNTAIQGPLTINSGATVATTGDGTGLGYNGQITSVAINGGVLTSGNSGMHIYNVTSGVTMTGGELRTNDGVSSPSGSAVQWNYTSLTTNASAASAVVSGRVNLRGDAGYSSWAVSVADGAAATDLLVSAAITELVGSVGITKSGAGTMTLSGANTYTGATNVNAGKLLVNGSLAAGSAVSVASGATLGGSGSIAGAATMDGILSPGNSPGVISFGSLVLGGTSTTLIEIAGTSRGTQYDGVDITTSGGLTYGGLLSLDFSGLLSAVANNTTFNIFSFAGSPSGDVSSVTSTGLYSGTWANVGSGNFELVSGGQTLTFSQATGDIVVVPEPGSVALAALGIGLGAAISRRRRARSRIA